MGRPRKKAEGLGDTIAKITEVTGIAKATKWLLGEDCGCDERKEALNRIFRYNTILCLTENEYELIKEHNLLGKDILIPSEQMHIIKIYNRIFSQQQEMTNCAQCLAAIVKKMRLVYNEYKDKI